MPTKLLFLAFPYYSLPHSSYQPNLLYKPTLFSFKVIFLKQRNTHRERVRGLDKVAICHVGPSPSWSQWGIVLVDHNSRLEREKVVFFFNAGGNFKVHTLWSAWLLFSFFFIQKILQKENLNYYSFKSIMSYLNTSIWIPLYVCCGFWKKKKISSLNSLFLFPLLK